MGSCWSLKIECWLVKKTWCHLPHEIIVCDPLCFSYATTISTRIETLPTLYIRIITRTVISILSTLICDSGVPKSQTCSRNKCVGEWVKLKI